MRRFRVLVNGMPYEVEVEEASPAGAGQVPSVAPAPALAAAPVAAPAARPQAPAPRPAPRGAGGPGNVTAPLPGVILDIRVSPGDQVEAGQVVAVLEAMKMENDIAAPVAGSVKEVRVTKGQAVALGEVLVVIEP